MAGLVGVVCIAVLLLCIWMFPGLFNNPALTNPLPSDPSGTGQQDPTNSLGANQQILTVTELCPLVFNMADFYSMPTDFMWPIGSFTVNLNKEQLRAVLPNLNLTLSAFVVYANNGSFLSLRVNETQIIDGIEYPGTTYGASLQTEIQVGLIFEDCIVVPQSVPEVSVVHETPVMVYMTPENPNYMRMRFRADFELDAVVYRVEIHDSVENGPGRLTEIVNTLILGGGANLDVLANPVIPELDTVLLTLSSARLDPVFGQFVPLTIPDGYDLNIAYRLQNAQSDVLLISIIKPDNTYVVWTISRPTEKELETVVSVEDHEKYDMALYPAFWTRPFPSGLEQFIIRPVFRAEELTLDVVRARMYRLDDSQIRDPGWEIMPFYVLYDDTIVLISTNNATPEDVWKMLAPLLEPST